MSYFNALDIIIDQEHFKQQHVPISFNFVVMSENKYCFIEGTYMITDTNVDFSYTNQGPLSIAITIGFRFLNLGINGSDLVLKLTNLDKERQYTIGDLNFECLINEKSKTIYHT